MWWKLYFVYEVNFSSLRFPLFFWVETFFPAPGLETMYLLLLNGIPRCTAIRTASFINSNESSPYFRLSPCSRWDLRSCGILSSVQWHFLSDFSRPINCLLIQINTTYRYWKLLVRSEGLKEPLVLGLTEWAVLGLWCGPVFCRWDGRPFPETL